MNVRFTDESSELLQTLVETSLTNTYVARAVRDPATGQITDFRITLVNTQFQKWIGSSVEELQATTLLTLFPQFAQLVLFAHYIEVVETGQTYQGEDYHPFRNGNAMDWFTLSVRKQGDGIMVNFLGIPAEQLKLQRQAEQLRATLDASLNSIFYMKAVRDDQTGQIIDFLIEFSNQAVLSSTNLKPEEVIGQRLLEKFPGNKENGFFDSYVRVVETGQPEQMTQPYRDELGLEGWFQISAVRHDRDNVVVTFMNITESKQIEQQLRESNTSLEQFASVASHDLQEPLRKIQLFSTALVDQYGTALGKGVDLLKKMQSTTERMQSLIRDLLDYSRLSKGDDTRHQLVELPKLVEEVLIDLELAVQEKGASIEVGNLPTLMGNALQLRQVFQNLISNGLKFSKPGQAPHIRITSEKKGRTELPADVRLPGLPGQYYWQIKVRDQGIGFDEAYREKIFGAFERLHGRSSAYKGSGIGLAIVRKVMTNHHGLVVAHSREGAGATFTLYFPITEPDS
ncbi:hypothetical protein EXU85_22970 [Spirosoma sp. KCTC 42546]|uniref:sensor histidine kinase n=1 Tax=Spirosoma sp. KCTC 42546 TaxID=2520506 RepID=UPI00115A0FBD|nr:PAS domain-containing sensor histidine kinase [Spirosoma sp. KCTC 42546]QDK81316.1 hypothetical protein EXU85_22970 [Spirosoma sp. KCTC 42546]